MHSALRVFLLGAGSFLLGFLIFCVEWLIGGKVFIEDERYHQILIKSPDLALWILLMSIAFAIGAVGVFVSIKELVESRLLSTKSIPRYCIYVLLSLIVLLTLVGGPIFVLKDYMLLPMFMDDPPIPLNNYHAKLYTLNFLGYLSASIFSGGMLFIVDRRASINSILSAAVIYSAFRRHYQYLVVLLGLAVLATASMLHASDTLSKLESPDLEPVNKYTKLLVPYGLLHSIVLLMYYVASVSAFSNKYSAFLGREKDKNLKRQFEIHDQNSKFSGMFEFDTRVVDKLGIMAPLIASLVSEMFS